MDIATAKKLCQVNTDFYRAHAASFSETRRVGWAGWEKVLAAAEWGSKTLVAADGKAGESAAVLDVACGNMRFATFLAERAGECAYFGADNCAALVPDALKAAQFQQLDIVGALLSCVSEAGARQSGAALAAAIDAPCADLTVAFGFMHHIPTEEARAALLFALLAKTKPGGAVAVSFWEFLNSSELAAKAGETHARGMAALGLPPLNPGDYLLGWKNDAQAFRYCHNFTDDEIDRLVASVAGEAQVIARFSADGRTGNLNTYLVLRKNDASSLS